MLTENAYAEPSELLAALRDPCLGHPLAVPEAVILVPFFSFRSSQTLAHPFKLPSSARATDTRG